MDSFKGNCCLPPLVERCCSSKLCACSAFAAKMAAQCSACVPLAGLEYDLDLFNIVAVDDFNMGAMENKSLNIFNSRLVLASPKTATDLDYKRIEGVVAHEYFHNW